jgi:HPt (histidine-containing phosphotransfer) domain-containing protein
VSAYFDPARIAELQEVLGADTQAILSSMLTSMTRAIEQLEAAVAAGQLDHAIQAAHRARNDALMLNAARLQAALTELEAAARDADEPRTQDALERVRAVWPPTREELAGVARAT